jgi:GT2 family glycosyltransferase
VLARGSEMLEPNKKEVLPASLIICSRNRPTLLAEAVAYVGAGGSLPSEIIIIDQSNHAHPTLSTTENMHGCRVRYSWKPGVGVSHARNTGAADARNDLLAWIDDDVQVSREWFGLLAHALYMEGPNTIVTGQVRPGIAECRGGFAPSTITDEAPAVYCGGLHKDVLYSNNMAFSREVLRKIGGFDERLGPGTRFPAAEDNELCFRLLEAGYRIVYTPQALVYHRAWRDQFLWLRWRYGRGQGAFYAKYIIAYDRYGLKRLRSDIRRYLVRCCHRLPSERRNALGDLIYIGGLLSGASEWLLRNRRGHTDPQLNALSCLGAERGHGPASKRH